MTGETITLFDTAGRKRGERRLTVGEAAALMGRPIDVVPARRVASGPPLWFVVQTHAGHERKARAALAEAGHEVYLPTMRREVATGRGGQHQKRRVVREFVLFNRYLFACVPAAVAPSLPRLFEDELAAVLGNNGEPAPIDEAEVQRFRVAETEMLFDDTRAARRHRGETARSELAALQRRFPQNARVRVLSGPFGGFAGHVTGVLGRATIRAMLDLLGRLVPVEFAAEALAVEEANRIGLAAGRSA